MDNDIFVWLNDVSSEEVRCVGPLLADLFRRAESGGSFPERFSLARTVCERQTPAWVTQQLEIAGLRGRAGGGFPTGHKWSLVQRKTSAQRYFVCNATAAEGPAYKQRLLLGAAPERVIEAILCAAFAVRASEAYLVVSPSCDEEAAILAAALQTSEAHFVENRTWFGSNFRCRVHLVRSNGGFAGGEETALLETIEGRPAQPRGKPPLPTAAGLFGQPTAVSSLETVMHAAHILEFGPAAFRRVGGPNSPGTFLVTLSGDIERPGIYEIPLGTTVSELVFRHGGGIPRGRACLTVFPGGLTEPPLSENELAKALDYEGMYEAQTSLGAGVVVVVSDAHDPVDLTESLARAYSQISCGKCRPCSDGTKRIAVMLSNLDRLDERGIDRNGQMSGAKLHASSVLFPIITKTQPLSYTDTKQGLEKITHLCEFVKHRGDCQFPVGAMTSIQRLMHTFHEGFDARRQSSLPAATEAPPSVSALSRATASRLRNKEGSLTT